MFATEPTWEYFLDSLKGKYYLVGIYEDQYMRWTTSWQERDQVVLEFTNNFHTLHIKMGIRDCKKNLVLKYYGFLHKLIQTKWSFWTCHHWESLIDMLSKLNKNLSKGIDGFLDL